MPTAPLDRFQAAVSAFVRELFPNLDYQGFYEYSVYAFDESAQTATLQNTTASSKMPQALSKVPVRLQGAGTVTLSAGSTVLVGFENGSPTTPFIAFYGKTGDAPEKKLYLNVTTELKLGTNAALQAARQGDMVAVTVYVAPNTAPGSPPGSFVIIPSVGGVIPPPPAVPLTLYGLVSSGSPIVKSA